MRPLLTSWLARANSSANSTASAAIDEGNQPRSLLASMHDKAKSKITFVNVDRGKVLASAVSVAGTSAERRKGLLGVENLNVQDGLWIVPCEAIHTFRMKTDIDAVFLNRKLRVVSLRENLRPNCIAVCLFAHSVLELAPGALARSGTDIGDQLEKCRIKTL